MFLKTRKIVSMLIIFVITFTYMGQTLEAIATTDGLSAITSGFFNQSDVMFGSYFIENGSKTTGKVIDVNEKATVVFEVSPTNIGEGFIKDATISLNTEDEGNAGFKFSKINDIKVLEDEVENKVENETEDEVIEENNEQETAEEEIENVVEEEVKLDEETNLTETEKVENEVTTEDVSEDEEEKKTENEIVDTEETESDVEEQEEIKTEEQEVVSRAGAERESEEVQDDELINEEEVIKEVLINEEEEEDNTLAKYQVDIVSDNEIRVQNIIHKTVIEVEIEYVKNETLNIEDLYKEVNFNIEGKYINTNLEEKTVNASSSVTIGWKYNKDIEVEGSYTKFSPYQVGERQGSILENKIQVKRQTEDENYLPLKNINMEIKVPELNGEKPSSVSVVANKLMASKGQDVGQVEFSNNNWSYNKDEGKLNITVTNDGEQVSNTLGTDEYVIVYKYTNFVEEGIYTFGNNVIVNAEEYSANEKNKLSKTIATKQQIEAVIGDMISYSITTNEEAISKGKINANYNQEVGLYETEFNTTVSLNILTSDMFEELKVVSDKENYLNAIGAAFEANDIYYKKVKFSYNEVSNALANGGSIEILNNNNELLYTLNAELVKSQEDCVVNLDSKPTGVNVVLKNVSVNQNLSIEFTKAIGKSNYDKATFNTFRQLQSTVSATVKYADDERIYNLSEISVNKTLKNSSTMANISLSNNSLSPTSVNENVEIKVELNNHSADSDLYVNPVFELVFPQYVKKVDVQNLNLTYGNGLNVENAEVYTENDIVKLRIVLTGAQTTFSESALTNGTNILITASITLDDYTPAKKDQIKMYYYNEAVTNYESQTKWTINKEMPQGIIRETNGFDAVVINYSAPIGLITSNAIVNYDGQLSTVKSVRQGEKVAKVAMDSASRIVKMQLYVANNTGNECSNIRLIGRVPFKGNTDVISQEDLGTTVNTTMLSEIKEDITNFNMTTIYYSENENANTDLSNSTNAWTTEPQDIKNVKSYMIVVKGSLAAGSILRYTYDFEVPENLDYDTSIYGSFGAYYDNNTETAIVSETSSADKVGLKTEIGIPVTIDLQSDVAGKTSEGRFINYTIKVTNESDDTLENIILNNIVPEGTTLYEKSFDQFRGDNGYVPIDKKELEWTIERLKSGENYLIEYTVKVNSNMADKKVENIVYAKMDDLTQRSNKDEVNITASSLNIEVGKTVQDSMAVGEIVVYEVSVTNITDTTENNIKLKYSNPNELRVDFIRQGESEENLNYNIDTKTLENIYTISELKPNETKTYYIWQTAINYNKTGVTSKILFELEDGTVESSSELNFKINSVNLKISQSTDLEDNVVNIGDEIRFSLSLENVGKTDATNVKVCNDISEYLEVKTFELSGEGSYFSNSYDSNTFEKEITLFAGEQITFTIIAKVKDDTVGKVISNRWKVTQDNIGDMQTDEMLIKITEGQNKVEVEKEENTGIYSISGTTWVDVNQNGTKDEEDTTGVQAQVQLLKDGTVIKAQTTNSDGSYMFKDLQEGNYTVVTNYDSSTYATTLYNSDIQNSSNSNVYETVGGTAVTDNIEITNSNIENLNIGLVEKEKFDFAISESIVKAIVSANGKTKEYNYNNLDLAKIQMKSKELKNSTIKVEYKIRVENVGNIDGKVSSIVNYVPNGMEFIESDNSFWSLGTDGNIYYSGLKDTTIKAGDFQDVTLILQMNTTSDSSVILSNKAQIAYTESSTRILEAKENNLASQETVITKDSGLKKSIIVIEVSIIAIIAIFGYMIKTEKIETKGFIKKIYR